MSHKAAKKIRRKLLDVNERAPVVTDASGKPVRLLMNRKDPLSHAKARKFGGLAGTKVKQGGAINHPGTLRALYQQEKKKERDG